MDPTTALTDRMAAALAHGAQSWDRSVGGAPGVDMRSIRGLIRRGLVDVTTGPHSYYSPRKGWWVTRTVITDVKINDAGRAALARHRGE
ncbi:hypothetical protein [Streptomyces sp. NPDC049879]|uniref:hypothetical protein n=1 Tax=Streptomyces sp. NPDC049879 TaxID=3365598 RepID=UPI00379EC6E0